MVIIAVAIAAMPNIRHFLLFSKLQISLINRIGPIWEEGPHIRLSMFRTSYVPELDEIEERFGPQLTDQEKVWLRNSRRQHDIALKWAIAAFCTLMPLIILLDTFIR